MLKVTEINKEKYLQLGSKLSNSTFLQNPDWIDFKISSSNYLSEYFEILLDDLVIGAFSILIKKVLGVKTAYIPRTNIFFNKEDTRYTSTVLEELKKRYRFIILELDTFFKDDNLLNTLKDSSFKTSAKYIQPPQTLITNTTLVNEDMLCFPSSYHRRNIRKGLKMMSENNLKFEMVNKLNDEELLKASELINSLGKSKEFGTRSYDYFKKLQNTLDNICWFVVRNSKNELLVANLELLDKRISTCFDLYIGKDKIANQLLLHHVVKYLSFLWCKENGFTKYDHWGVFPDDPKKAHFSEFKLKFGGDIINYPKLMIYSKFPFNLISKFLSY